MLKKMLTLIMAGMVFGTCTYAWSSERVMGEVKESIINETFETAYLSIPITDGYNKKIQGVDNNIIYNTSEWSNIDNVKTQITDDAQNGKVLTNTFGTLGYHVSTIKFENHDISPINSGDELHISFDFLYTANSGGLEISLNDTKKLAFTAKEYPGEGAWLKSVAGTGVLLKINNNRIMPCGSDYYQNGWSNGYGVIEPGKWYNFKIIIKTKDKSYSDNQTITIIASDGENKTMFLGTLDKVFNGIRDINNNISTADKQIDRIIDFSELTFRLAQNTQETGGSPTDYSFDNLKVDIVKPGFSVSGAAVLDYGIRPTGFLPGKNVTVKCAADVSYIKNEQKAADMIVAQYNGDKLIKVEMQPVTITNEDFIFTHDTTVAQMVDEIKAFLLEKDLSPEYENFKLTNTEEDNETDDGVMNSLPLDFEDLEDNLSPDGVSYINFKPEAGVFSYTGADGAFGKYSGDRALKISNNSDAYKIVGFTGQNKNIRYQAASFKTGRLDLEADDTVVLGFEFANESNNAIKTIKAEGYINGADKGEMPNLLEIGKDASARVLGHNVAIKGADVIVQNGKWYNVRIIIKPADDFSGTVNRFSVYWDGILVLEDLPFEVGGKVENAFDGFSNIEVGYDISSSPLDGSTKLADGSAAQYNPDAVYADNIKCEVLRNSEPEKTDLTLMSASAYYANTIDMPKATIYDYGQSPGKFVAKLRADNMVDACFVDVNGNKMTDSISGGYLKISDTFGDDIYYKVFEGTDEDLLTIADVDAENEGNPDLSKYFVYEQPDIEKLKGSALDASFVLDAPAGKYGFVHRQGEDFVFDNGEKIQFWGINIGGQGAFPETKKEAEAIAQRVAAAGFNLVRIHNIDGGTKPNVFGYNNSGKELDEEHMDKLCYLLAELKERGIYFFIDQTCYRPAFPDDELDSMEGITLGLKGPTYFNRKVIEIQKDYSEMLLSYKNPYTGLSLAEDPAMAMVGLNNEFTITNYDLHKLGDYYYKELGELFSAWLVEKYGTRQAVEAAWLPKNSASWGDYGLLDDEDPTKGTVMMRCSDAHNLEPVMLYTMERENDEMAFLAKIMKDYLDERITHLRQIGVKCAITGNTAFGDSEPPVYYPNTYTDFIDYHNYWSHPLGGNGLLNSKGLYFNAYNTNQSVLENTASDKRGLMGIIGTIATRRIHGYPLVISEWMFCPGNPYLSEGMLLTAAYGRLQGWHPILFALNSKSDYFSRVEEGYEFVQSDPFTTSDNPIYSSAYPAASIMYLRKDVQEAQSGYYNSYDEDEIFVATDHQSIWWGSYKFKPMNEYGLIGKTGTAFEGRSDTPQNDETIKDDVENAKTTGVYASNTGELVTDVNDKIFKMNTDKSKGVAGFIGGKKVELGGVEVTVDNDFATVMFTSLDNSPILSSERVLLTLLGNSRNYGQIFSEDGNTVIKGGKAPIITEQITGKFRLLTGGYYNVYALSSSGERIKEIPVAITHNGVEFTIDENAKAMNFEIVANPGVLIYESFESYPEKTYTLRTASEEMDKMPENENISYKKYYNWNKRTVGISSDGKNGNAIAIEIGDGAMIKIDSPLGTTDINKGDIIHINFDTAHSGPGAWMNLNINENPSASFALKYYYDLRWIENFTAQPMILGMYYDGNGAIIPSINRYNGIAFPVDTWKNVDVVIDTQDEEYEGAQTIKVSIDGVYYWCGTYDANYTGDGDKTIDPFTTFSSLSFDTNGGYASSANTVKYDNIKVFFTKED